jgi:predicted NUDIX family NTP pyrophosphohydrolase
MKTKRCGTICIKNIFGLAHILAVRGKFTGIWSLPKGCINEGESEEHCAHRETLEESGLFVHLTNESPRLTINNNVYFIVPVKTHPRLHIRDTNEVDKVNWLTIDDMKEMDCNKDLRSMLKERKHQALFT